MIKRFESASLIKEILSDSKISLWEIETEDGKEPKMYGNSAFYEIMGMNPALSPEENYRFWFERIGESEKPRVLACVDEMMKFRHSEVEYSWNHPEKGLIYIRSGGKRDASYSNPNGVRLWGSHHDISEIVGARKEIESKLERSENEVVRLNMANEEKNRILNNLSEGVAVVRRTPDGISRLEFISEGFASMMRMRPEEIMGAYREDIRSAVHPDDRERVDKELDEYFLSGKEHSEITFRMKRGDGTYFWVKNSITQMESEGGVRKLYCLHIDLTEEIEKQDKLRKNYRERLDRHLRSAGRNVLLLGQCNITRDVIAEIIDYTDSGLNEKFGSSRNAFITGVSAYITDEEERRGFLGTFLNEPAIRAYRNGFTKLEKICMVKFPKDETGRYARFFARLLEDPDTGDITGNLSVTDMTEQIIRERIMLNLAYVGYDMVSEIDLNRDKQRIMRNWQSGDFSGVESNYYEYVENFIEKHICEEDREKVEILLERERLVEKLEKSGSFSINYSTKNENGEIRFKNLTVLATDLRLGKICFARKDITETVEAERKSKAEIEQALAAAEKASRAKDAFLSSMSHDIRTPMNAIIGFAEIIAQNTGDKAVVENSVKKILKSGDVLLKLINDILDLSKIESGKATLDLTAVDLYTEIENLSVMFSESIKQAGVKFVVVKNVYNRYVLCDSTKFSQIMVNILGNAVKFTQKGGRIVFSINERGKSENGFAEYVFSVKDTGIGMSENFRSHAFEMFEREKTTTETGISGTGLGLAIVKRLVEMMGGEVGIFSELGRGTEVVVTLKLQITDVSNVGTGKLSTDAVPDFTGKRLLLVEDNEMNREIASAILSELGFVIEQAENGAIAVDKVANSDDGYYDIILMDLQMPVMDGYKATREIRALPDRALSEIPIVAMTANAFVTDRQKCLEAGMNAHISKPIDVEALKKTLGEELSKSEKVGV